MGGVEHVLSRGVAVGIGPETPKFPDGAFRVGHRTMSTAGWGH